jgi:hemerythrin-like domain-containing protein
MPLPTQPLRDEHRELLPSVESFRTVADSVGEVPIDRLRKDVDAVYDFLVRQLIPHAQAEEAALYPIVSRMLCTEDSTAPMRRDHTEIWKLTQELVPLRQQLSTKAPTTLKALRRILYGLYALVKVHFIKEEEIYLPLIDTRLPPDEVRQMYERMEKAAQDAKDHLTHAQTPEGYL